MLLKKNVRHLRLSNTSLKVLLGSCDNSAHRLSYRYHSNRDVTSQYFPMKACVAKQLAVCSGKIQGCFLADESYICVCLCVCACGGTACAASLIETLYPRIFNVKLTFNRLTAA